MFPNLRGIPHPLTLNSTVVLSLYSTASTAQNGALGPEPSHGSKVDTGGPVRKLCHGGKCYLEVHGDSYSLLIGFRFRILFINPLSGLIEVIPISRLAVKPVRGT